MGKWLAEDNFALWCDHSTSYKVLLLLYGRIVDLHRNSIYAISSEGNNDNNSNNNNDENNDSHSR